MTSSIISAVIPAYNAEAQIARAIMSARASGIETIVVVDDGSTDCTGKVAEELGCSVLRQSNQGAAQARIAGLGSVTSELVVFLDADDELVPDGVGELVSCMRQNQALTGIHGWSVCTASNGSTKYMGSWPEGIDLLSLLHRGISPGPAGSFVWRTAALSTGLHSNVPALWPRLGEDYELLLRLAMTGPIGQQPTTICRYTLSGGKSAVSPFRDNVAAERIRRHYADLNGVKIRERRLNEIKSLGHLRDAYSLRGPRNLSAKVRHLVSAICLTPSLFPRYALRRVQRNRKSLTASMLAGSGFPVIAAILCYLHRFSKRKSSAADS